MLISIIIPVYNVEKYIAECLDSVVAQTYKGDIECIIVNDCTPDNSMSVVKDFIDSYSGDIAFSIINHAQNRGLSAARNTGINAAKGDYIYLLDSDDLIIPDCIELLAAPLEYKEYEMVVADIVTFGDERYCPRLELSRGEYLHDEIIESYMKRLFFPMAVNKLCNRSFLLNNGILFKEGILHEDELWSFILAYSLNTMYVIDKETYRYRIHGHSIMANKDVEERSGKSKIAIYCEILSYLKPMDSQNRVFYYYFRNTHKSLLNLLFKNCSYNKKIFCRYLKLNILNPFVAYKNRAIPFKHLLRDMYLLLPESLAFYYWRLYIKLRGSEE